MTAESPKGVLRPGWTAGVGEYAIAGGWTQRGELLVVGDAAGGVYAFDGRSGANVWSRPGVHEGGVLALDMHPSRPEFASAGQDGRALVWNAADGQVDRTIKVGDDWVEHLAWSPNGRSLAASCSRNVSVHGPGQESPWRSEDHPSTVSAIAWSSSTELASACYGRVTFFDVPAGKSRQKLEWIGSLVSMALSPDGDIVACGSQDNTVHFWRRSTGLDSMMSGYPGKPSALAFDGSGTLLATGGGSAITVWSFRGDGPEGTRPGVLDLHVLPVTTLAFARRGMRLASGDREGGVVVWSLKHDGEGDPKGASTVNGLVGNLYWRPDGRALAALDAQGEVTVWRVGNR